MKTLKLMLISVALGGAFAPAAEAQRVKKIGERKISDLARASACNKVSAPRIGDPQVRVEVNRAYISFTSLPNASPYVELSKVQPVVTPDGCLGFPSGKAIGAWPVPRITDGGLFFIYLEKYTKLEPGTKYYYVINNPDVNVSIDAKQSNSRAQDSGSFTTINTLTQTVKVVFTNMYVLSDSDPDSAGDLGFNFGARKRDGSFNWRSSGLDKWESGDKRRIQQELVIENAPDLLFLVVEGYDNDSTTDYFPRRGPTDADSYNRQYKKGPGEIKGISGMEWNVAINQFDLTAYPGMTATQHFTMQSMPLGRNTGDLVFQVSGYFEVTRH